MVQAVAFSPDGALVAAYWRRGQRSVALAQYQSCREILAAELRIEPDRETTALYEQIRTGPMQPQPASIHAAAPTRPATPLIDYSTQPHLVTVTRGTWLPSPVPSPAAMTQVSDVMRASANQTPAFAPLFNRQKTPTEKPERLHS